MDKSMSKLARSSAQRFNTPDSGDYVATPNRIPPVRTPRGNAKPQQQQPTKPGINNIISTKSNQPTTELVRTESQQSQLTPDNNTNSNEVLNQDSNIATSAVVETSSLSKWLTLVHDKTIRLPYCFNQHLALCDIRGGSNCATLVCGDIGNKRLLVYSGYAPVQYVPLPDIPSAVCSLYADSNTTRRIPLLAVACTDCVLFYRNLRALYRFRVPYAEPLSELEKQLWRQALRSNAESGSVDADALYETLKTLTEKSAFEHLTPLTQRYLSLVDSSTRKQFLLENNTTAIGRPDVITCMTTCKRESNAGEAVSCLVFTTEHNFLYVLDAARYILLSKRLLPAPGVLLHCHGLYDIDYRIIVSCRDACVYVFRNAGSSDPTSQFTTRIPLCCPVVGIARMAKEVVLTCIDSSMRAYRKDNLQWKFMLTSTDHVYDVTPTCLLSMEFEAYSSMTGVIVALSNKTVRIYMNAVGAAANANTTAVNSCPLNVFDQFATPDVVVAMHYGKFAREDGCLIMVLANGNLFIRVLKRTAMALAEPSVHAAAAAVELLQRHQRKLLREAHQLPLPMISKLFLDQSLRERQAPAQMYSTFYSDLFDLKYQMQQTYTKAVQQKLLLNNNVGDAGSPADAMGLLSRLSMQYEILGAGPLFQLTLLLNYASSSAGDERNKPDLLTNLILFVEPGSDEDDAAGDDEDENGIELLSNDNTTRHWNYLPPLVAGAQHPLELKFMLKVSRLDIPTHVTVHLLSEKQQRSFMDDNNGDDDLGDDGDDDDAAAMTRVIFRKQIELPIFAGDFLESL